MNTPELRSDLRVTVLHRINRIFGKLKNNQIRENRPIAVFFKEYKVY